MISNLLWIGGAEDGGSKGPKCENKSNRSEPKEHWRLQCQQGQMKMDEAKKRATGRDSTLPSVGLMAAGKLSHGSVHVGEG